MLFSVSIKIANDGSSSSNATADSKRYLVVVKRFQQSIQTVCHVKALIRNGKTLMDHGVKIFDAPCQALIHRAVLVPEEINFRPESWHVGDVLTATFVQRKQIPQAHERDLTQEYRTVPEFLSVEC